MTTQLPRPFSEDDLPASLDTFGPSTEDEQDVEIAYYMSLLDEMQQRIWNGDCIAHHCGAVATPGGLTCGDHECKLWVGHMPDTLRAYLIEEKLQAVASETIVRPVQWGTQLLNFAVGAFGSVAALALFAVGARWLRW